MELLYVLNMLRYVGDSKRLRSRVRQHCKGNVESSALRKTIATEMGFEIVSKKRSSGSRKLSAEPSNAEQIISAYIQSGTWKVVVCSSSEEARDLAIILRAGALPAPVIILENRTVGPSLGQDSINKGITSIIYGGLVVVAFIAVYYKLSGIIAVIALFLNIVLLAGALAYFGAALTLPGIAGIILTVGMAIDANVLVFERIREELRIGKTVRAAIDAGFSKAFRTIVDANITTFIAAVVLFQFGTGPIKGFAITLCIGIAASMFTAVFVSRAIFDGTMSQRKLDKLSI